MSKCEIEAHTIRTEEILRRKRTLPHRIGKSHHQTPYVGRYRLVRQRSQTQI